LEEKHKQLTVTGILKFGEPVKPVTHNLLEGGEGGGRVKELLDGRDLELDGE